MFRAWICFAVAFLAVSTVFAGDAVRVVGKIAKIETDGSLLLRAGRERVVMVPAKDRQVLSVRRVALKKVGRLAGEVLVGDYGYALGRYGPPAVG